MQAYKVKGKIDATGNLYHVRIIAYDISRRVQYDLCQNGLL